MELVSQVLAQEGLIPKPNDPGDKDADIIELVEAVNRHARALVLLAPELAAAACARRRRTCIK